MCYTGCVKPGCEQCRPKYVDCPACGLRCSLRADTCPKCGAEIDKRTKDAARAKWKEAHKVIIEWP